MKKKFMLFVMTLLVVACNICSATGTFELNKVSSKYFKDFIVRNYVLTGKFQVISQTDNSFVLTPLRTNSQRNLWADALLGANRQETLTFSFVENNDKLVGSVSLMRITSPGTFYQNTTYFPKEDNEISEFINVSFNGVWKYGFNSKTTGNEIVVKSVEPGSPFELAGIKKDDKIIAINGKSIKELGKTQADTIVAVDKSALFTIKTKEVIKEKLIEKVFIKPTEITET